MAQEKLPATNSTAEKLLIVIEALASHAEPVRLIDLAHELEMNPATTYRFLTALVNRGYVTQYGESDRYAMTFKICRIADTVRSQYGMISMLHGFVVEANQVFWESAHLSKRENDSIVYIDNASASSQMLSIRQYIGKVAPLHCTGVGKLFLADEASHASLNNFLAHNQMERYTIHTITTKEALLDELQKVRRLGYAMDNEECEIGVRCVAAPVYDFTGRMVAGLSISGPTTRITEASVPEISAKLLEIAGRASAVMGFQLH